MLGPNKADLGIALATAHPEGVFGVFQVIVKRGSDLTLTHLPSTIKTVGDFQVRSKREHMYQMA